MVSGQNTTMIWGCRAANRRRGMTLFELAVVMTIAVILVGLAFFSTQNILTQTKVSRVHEEHRALARAIQNYMMDYSMLPTRDQGLSRLTHPTAYMGTLPKDPFQLQNGTYLYLVPDSNAVASVLISPGPDGDFDLPAELWRFAAYRDVDPSMVPQDDVRIGELLVGVSPTEGGANTNTRANAPATPYTPMSETEAAVLNTYLKLGQYDPEKGEDGDIIAVIRY